MKVPFLDLKAQYESIKDEINEAIQKVLDSCAFAGGPFVEEFEKNFRIVWENPQLTNKRLKLFWISVGNEDFLYKQTAEFMNVLKEKNINFKSMITDGGHTWMNMKKFMEASSQLLFR